MNGELDQLLEREQGGSFFLPEFYHETVNIRDILKPEYMIVFFKNQHQKVSLSKLK